MRRYLFAAGITALTTLSLQASDFDQKELDSLNRRVAKYAALGDDTLESKTRLERICFFYNYDLNDSLYAHADDDMEFNRQHGFWDNYYETWEHKANDLIFSGKVNTGLRELKQMHDDALERNHKYGLGLAYYGMGNAYISMEHYDEAVENYRQAKTLLLEEPKASRTMILDLYSYYCDALNWKHDYATMLSTLPAWRKVLESIEHDSGSSSSRVWYAYYYLACSQAHLGLGHYKEAAKALDEVQARTDTDGNFIYMSHLYYRAQLLMATNRLGEALRLNDERIAMSKTVNDVSSPVMLHRQRAEILKHMGRYREAADAYLTMYLLKDSLDNRQMRDQTNEMATLYRVDELAREQEMTNQRIAATKRYERMRLFTVALCLGGFFLLVFLVYWYVNSRRLRRKNEELTVAHRQAQESSLMKTKFIQNMSHEIRTPLNIVSGFSQILTQSGDDLPAEQKKEVCEKIEENTNRITTLITQLLDLSESDSIAVIERNDDVACNDICRQAIIRSKVGDNLKRHFTFDTTLSDDERIITSASYAVEALSRLLNNAQKFSNDGSTIRLTCDKDQDTMVVAVENDTTQPIPSDQAEHIFEPFVQLNDFLEGVGIGLTVSRNVVRRLGGDIRLDTTAAPTVRFIFTLPLHTAT